MKKSLALITPMYSQAEPFCEKYAAVKTDGKWGFIDTSGKVIVKPEYDATLGFADGLAAVKRGDLWGYVDATGMLVIATKFQRANSFHQGMARAVLSGKQVVIDKRGKPLFQRYRPSLQRSSPR